MPATTILCICVNMQFDADRASRAHPQVQTRHGILPHFLFLFLYRSIECELRRERAKFGASRKWGKVSVGNCPMRMGI